MQPLVRWLALIGAAPVAAEAQVASPMVPARMIMPIVVRATVIRRTGTTLIVAARNGERMTIKLAPTATVAALEAIDIDTIAPGSAIGTATEAGTGDTLEAIEVHVFPPSMRGMGEGHTPWDLVPNGSMTNGRVGAIGGTVSGAKDRTITVRYGTSEKRVHVPASAAIVGYTTGTLAQIQAGTHIFAIATKAARGALVARRVVFGRAGLVPPM